MEPESPSIATYEDFLRAAIRRYWESSGASKATFLALLLATEDAWKVDYEGKAQGVPKPLLAGAAGVATMGVLLRFLASGPLDFLLSGLAVGSLLAVYTTEHEAIRAKAGAMEPLVERHRVEFEELREERRRRHIRDAQWDLMMQGLMGQVLDELHEAPVGHDPASISGFAEHVHTPTIVPPSED
ncbi:MAG: hypothetical protein U0230_01660 [Polyangiales bacterium]